MEGTQAVCLMFLMHKDPQNSPQSEMSRELMLSLPGHHLPALPWDSTNSLGQGKMSWPCEWNTEHLFQAKAPKNGPRFVLVSNECSG